MILGDFTVRSSDGLFRFSIDTDLLVENGVCTMENSCQIATVLSSWISLLGDSPLTWPLNKKPRGVIRSFYSELLTTPYADIVKRYSGLFDDLTTCCELSSSSESFCSRFIDGFRSTPVFKEYHAFYRTGDVRSLQYLLTFTRFAKKAEYLDDSLSQNAFRAWLDIEEELACPITVGAEHITGIKAVISSVLAPLLTDDFYPKFGPGAVSNDGVRGSIQKADNLLYHPRLDMAFYRNNPFKRDHYDREDPAFRSRFVDPDDWNPNCLSIDHSELRFVPKDVSKVRSICMEPNSFMYHQQVVQDWLRNSISDGLLGRFVTINDQSNNRNAALFGSAMLSVDTIDLSSASDRIRYDLVTQVFPKEFLYYLIATRTSKVLCPDGAMRRVKKFAPMGSAVCFPVQSILFASVVIYAMMLYDIGWDMDLLNSPLTRELSPEHAKWYVPAFLQQRVLREYNPDTSYTGKFEQFHVYGDDIVCDTRVTDFVTYLLTSLGLSVNVDKSFTGSHLFRESCGIFAFNGEDVTPYAYKVRFWNQELNPGTYASLVDAVNRTDEMGYRHLSSTLLRILLTTPLSYGAKRRRVRGSRVNPVPFVTRREAFGVCREGSLQRLNSHLRTRWNSAYQRREFYCVVPKVLKKERPTELNAHKVERHLYLQYVRARRSGSVSRMSYAAPRWRPEETGLEGRWLPLG